MTDLYPRAVIQGSLIGKSGKDGLPGAPGAPGAPGLPGPGAIPALEAVTAYIDSASTVRDAIDARVLEMLPTFDPDAYGASTNPLVNNRDAIQAAIDEASAAGGGAVQLRKSRRYGWRGILTVRNGVYLVGTSTRQNLDPTLAAGVPGLVALDATAQLRVGDWTTDAAPGGVSCLYVDGNRVGGAFSLAKQGLVRLAGVDVQIDRLFAVRSAGDGRVFDGLQNSSVHGGGSTFHEGVADVMDNGMGAVSFHGGYVGTSNGGPLTFRDTPDEASLYYFGPAQNNWFGTIFESYDAEVYGFGSPHQAHVHIKCGQNNTFYGCNFTGGADNLNSAVMLVDSSDTFVPTTVRFDSCVWWSYPEHDYVRVVGNQVVQTTGTQYCSDNGTDHAESFFCVDAGQPHINAEGEFTKNAAVPMFRAINAGTFLQCFTQHHGGAIYSLTNQQVVGVRRPDDEGHRQYTDQDGNIVWYDGTNSGIPKGFMGRGTDTGVYVDGGVFDVRAGLKSIGVRDRYFTFILGAAADTLSALNAVHLVGYPGGGTPTLSFSDEAEGREIKVMIAAGNWTTINFGAGIEADPWTVPAGYHAITFTYSDGYGVWMETSRSGETAAVAASDSVAGVTRYATPGETVTGTVTDAATTPAGVKAALAALVDAAPGALDTLNELAAALGDDPNFAATVTAALTGKVDKAYEFGQSPFVFAGANETLDAAAYRNHRVYWAGGGVTTLAFSNPSPGAELEITLIPGGPTAVTWPATVKWGDGQVAPALVPGTYTVVTFRYDADVVLWVELSRSSAPTQINGTTQTALDTKASLSQVTQYTAAQANTPYVIPAGAKALTFRLASGGGGGGSGARMGPGVLATGGGSGSSGISEDTIPVSAFGVSTLYVTVGAGGAGGAAVTVDSTAGNPGLLGGTTYVTTTAAAPVIGNVVCHALSGSPGNGGTSAGAAGGGVVIAARYSTAGVASSATGLIGGAGGGGGSGHGGSGSGGGITTANAQSAGGACGYISGRYFVPVAGGAAGGGVGSPASTGVIAGPGRTAGASGGGSSLASAAGAGGAGLYGAGGAGGGASRNGFNSGAGGAGGTGFVEIIAEF